MSFHHKRCRQFLPQLLSGWENEIYIANLCQRNLPWRLQSGIRVQHQWIWVLDTHLTKQKSFFLKLWTSDSSEYLALPIIIARYIFMSYFYRRYALINPQYHFFQFKIDHQTTFSLLYKQYILLITFSKMRKLETNWVFIIYTYYIYHCFYKACWIILVIKMFLLSQRVLVWTFVMYNI